jgi:hypothetical protein
MCIPRIEKEAYDNVRRTIFLAVKDLREQSSVIADWTLGRSRPSAWCAFLGCRMPVEMIIDQWNPSQKKHRSQTFCYRPKSCSLYLAWL